MKKIPGVHDNPIGKQIDDVDYIRNSEMWSALEPDIQSVDQAIILWMAHSRTIEEENDGDISLYQAKDMLSSGMHLFSLFIDD